MQVPAHFEYAKARTVEDALALLGKFGPDARVVAGGHSLIPMMKLRLANPAHLMDLVRSPGSRESKRRVTRSGSATTSSTWSAPRR